MISRSPNRLIRRGSAASHPKNKENIELQSPEQLTTLAVIPHFKFLKKRRSTASPCFAKKPDLQASLYHLSGKISRTIRHVKLHRYYVLFQDLIHRFLDFIYASNIPHFHFLGMDYQGLSFLLPFFGEADLWP